MNYQRELAISVLSTLTNMSERKSANDFRKSVSGGLYTAARARDMTYLCFISDSVASSQLYCFLEKNYICEDFQSGLRPSHSTETALIRVTNDLLLSSDRGCISLLVLLDLSVAFDTIDHSILLNILKNSFGISGSALAWFKSYLSDRDQFLSSE